MKLTYDEMLDIYLKLEYYKKGVSASIYEFETIDKIRAKLKFIMMKQRSKKLKSEEEKMKI